VNRDGRIDLAVSDLQGSRIRVFLGNGNGTFAAPDDYATMQPHSVIAADINRDGHLDLVAGNASTTTLAVFLNSGSGTFAAAVNHDMAGVPLWVAAADFNGDGTMDLAAANQTSNALAVRLGTGSCPFVEELYPSTGSLNGNERTTINGARLLGVTSVTMGGLAATILPPPAALYVAIRTPAHAFGDVTVVVTSPTGTTGVPCGFRYLDVPIAPTSLIISDITTTHVRFYWNAVPDATEYQIDRKSAGGGFVQVATVATTEYENPISPDSAYLYRVRAVSGGGVSPNSAPLLANTVIYASFFPTGVVTAIDLAQLRTAVNAVRALAGLSLATFTDPAVPGTIIRKVHIIELRTALNDARVALSFAAASFTDPILDGVVVKRIHHEELRIASGGPTVN
jgi:hypothetical protein